MAEPRPSPVLSIVLVVLVIVAGIGGIAYLYYEVNHKTPLGSALTVQLGDNVTVNYIGVFASGPQQGRVFDSSEYSVAMNNVAWPKSLLYQSRGTLPADYSPLDVHVGSAPPSGYSFGNLTFGGVVPGFWQGLLGLQGNQTRYITVPPSLGYPSFLINASCFVTRNLTTVFPVLVTLTPPEFTSIFTHVPLLAGVEFTDPVYGWQDQILSVNSTSVTYENLASIGMVSDPSGWPVVVTNLSSTSITLTSQLTPAQDGLILGHTPGNTVCGTTTFIITQVNLGTGTFVEDFGGLSSTGRQAGNQEVYGQTLIFIVSVVDIFRP